MNDTLAPQSPPIAISTSYQDGKYTVTLSNLSAERTAIKRMLVDSALEAVTPKIRNENGL